MYYKENIMDGITSSSAATVNIIGCCYKKKCPDVEFIPPKEWFSCKCLGKRSIEDQSNKVPFTEEKRAEMLANVASNEREYEKKLVKLRERISEMKNT